MQAVPQLALAAVSLFWHCVARLAASKTLASRERKRARTASARRIGDGDGSAGNTLVLQSLSRVGCRAFPKVHVANAAEAAFPAERTPWERRYSLEFRGPFRKLPQNPR